MRSVIVFLSVKLIGVKADTVEQKMVARTKREAPTFQERELLVEDARIFIKCMFKLTRLVRMR